MITLQILNIQKNAPGKSQQAAIACKNIRTSAPTPQHQSMDTGVMAT